MRVPFFSGVLGAFLGFYLLLVLANLALQLGLCRYFLVLTLFFSFSLFIFFPLVSPSLWVLSNPVPFVDIVHLALVFGNLASLIECLAFAGCSIVVTIAEKKLKRSRREW